MTVSYTEYPADKLVELRVSGRITRADFDDIAGRMQSFIDAQGTIRLIEVIESMDGFEPSMLWPGIKFDLRNLSHISHVAVVSDIGWLTPLSKAAGAVLTTKLRTFDMAHLDDARSWVRAG